MKTKKGSYLDANKIVLDYLNDLGKNASIPVLRNSLSAEETAIVDAYDALVTSKINALPQVTERATYVSYDNDAIAVSGESLPLKPLKYSEMSAPRKLIIDNLKAKIMAVKGVEMTKLFSKFGTNLVTINGIEYPYSDFFVEQESVDENDQPIIIMVPAPEFIAAITLANEIYNGL